jgi:hypothetical protein
MTLAAPRSRHATGGARRDPDMTLAAPATIPTCHWRRPPRLRHATGGAAQARPAAIPLCRTHGPPGAAWRAPSSGDGWEGFSDFVATMRGGGAHMGRQAHAFLQQCLGRVDTKCGRCHGHAISETSRGGAVTTGEEIKCVLTAAHTGRQATVRERSLRAKVKNTC